MITFVRSLISPANLLTSSRKSLFIYTCRETYIFSVGHVSQAVPRLYPYSPETSICITPAKKYSGRLDLVGRNARAYNCAKMAGHQHAGLLTDEALLHNIAHGCEDCFDLLFLRFFRPILSLAFKILRDRSEAEDVVQDVFFAIHRQRERFDPAIGPARTWVLQFGYYISLKRRKYLSNRHFYAPHLDEDGDGRDPALVQPEFIQRSVEQKEIIEQGLASLNPAQRRVMELLHFEGHTLREISEMEGRELGAIRNMYYRGLKALKTAFSEGVRRSQIRAMSSVERQEEYEVKL
jgi:RNA polymerase sigma-70 factor (ECF subfamily)